MIPTPEEAFELLKQYNEGEFHLLHGQIVGDVMRWYAVDSGAPEEADLWQTVGILHDLDFERWPEEHCVRGQELMREAGIDELVVRACASHGHGHCVDLPPESPMERTLFAVDELTGLVGAAAAMRPSKSVDDMELKSLKKKFKDKRFAAGCSRATIEEGARMLGIELDELLDKTIQAMRTSPHVQ